MQQHQNQQQQQQQNHPQPHYSSSPSLSSPPSGLSEPTSPTRVINAGRANIEMDEIIVDPGSAARFGIMQTQQSSEHPPGVQLTAAGVPRKKPGRKPGSTVKPKANPDGTPMAEAAKQRRPRKPKDPNAPPIQRKRKAATGDGNETNSEMDARAASGPPPPAAPPVRQPKITELTSMRMSLDAQPAPLKSSFVQAPKRESTGSMQMQNLLNDDPPPKPAAPAKQMFDPIRGSYDPVRETMATRDPYGTGPLASPRAPTTNQAVNRASASPSIASLVDPTPAMISPRPSQSYTATASQARFQEVVSVPPSPSNNIRSTTAAASTPAPSMPKPVLVEARRPPPPPPAAVTTPAPTSAATTSTTTSTAAAAAKQQEVKTTSFTTMSTIPSGSAASSAIAAHSTGAAAQSKKIAAVVQQTSSAKKARSSGSSPKINSLKDSKDAALPPLPGGTERSILDFGRAKPGEEIEAPSIALHIPIKAGENNKYVNFMRMAEERYGWDALHPRLAASRERKARIEAATLALEREKNGKESGDDEMEEDLQSDADVSNVEMGGMGGPQMSGPEAAPAKPARKKRNFKEDEYDKDDDFVDDSEMLWEEQAAASRDGFFVYSGPLVPEVEKPAVPEGPPKRGRGRGGRGSRGGARGAAAATAAAAAATATANGESPATTTPATGRGRGGGPGSRGGAVRKPRITKLEKEQRDREKAEREKLALLAKGVGVGGAPNGMSGLLSAPTPTPAAAGVGL
ncbi:hypothetical protein QBC42DRAFT_266000 [Cladorrhinum samala]|uniref:Hpc2-related domain-containing protein n=1 Tax=Cladorrhinum samala TaxID=585594 RepID=A0AAV9HR97_9PEZI|nr:hypothetical protein QBC42DRAFT_266000 [Cladorrhinum samala]